ncbi:hypothetical protein [Halovenus marina]|uniref:hypothetical protein n=1 Tax=Halovenus marina TaxID=3396621 RepID=UPI003F542765
MTEHTRRRILQLAGGSTAIALAGCLGSDDDDESGNDGMSDDGDGMDDGDDGMNDDDGMDDGDDGMNGDDGMDDGDDGMNDDDGMDDGDDGMSPTDPAAAPQASVDRFSEEAGTLLVRGDGNDLPGPDEAINFDEQPFLTRGLGPDGETVEYYNFDVQPTEPAPIYTFVDENGDPVEGQLNVIDVIPGDPGYNDFWRVNRVVVPDEYEANTATSVADISAADYDIEQTNVIKNCPVVPEGSTAAKHYGDDHDGAPVVEGWYDGSVVSYFLFEEDTIESMNGSVPLSPIYVSFNTNPGEDGGGPPSGFMTEEMSSQTHNVVATLPGSGGYSPLWSVNIYDNADFDAVSDLSSATDATILAENQATVNCPVVSVE